MGAGSTSPAVGGAALTVLTLAIAVAAHAGTAVGGASVAGLALAVAVATAAGRAPFVGLGDALVVPGGVAAVLIVGAHPAGTSIVAARVERIAHLADAVRARRAAVLRT